MKPIYSLFLTLYLSSMACIMAGTSGELTYVVLNENTIRITDCNTAAIGEITIPETLESHPVTSIGFDAFKDCVSVTRIILPDSISEIKDYAFKNCVGLASILLPSNVDRISTGAFQDCANLSRVAFMGNAPTQFQDPIFSGCAAGFKIYYMEGSTGFTSGTWNGYASGSISFPHGFKVIGTTTETIEISDCSTITVGTVDVPASIMGLPVTRIGAGSFSGCTGLTRISLPNTVTHIENDAFYECSGLTTFTISSQVIQIEDAAFQDCWSLSSIYFEGSAPQLGVDVFDGVAAGFKIHYLPANEQGFNDDDSPMWVALQGKLVEYSGNYTFSVVREHIVINGYSPMTSNNLRIPDTLVGKRVEVIGESAFFRETILTWVALPRYLKSIEEEAFAECTSLFHLTIPSSVTNVDRGAFQDTSDLTSVLFEGNAPTLGSNAFPSQASGFTIFYYRSRSGFDALWYGYTPETYTGPLEFSITDEVATITDCSTSTSGGFVIPDTILGKPVTTMKENTFLDCDRITSLSIPASLKYYTTPVFLYCSDLEQITVDPNNPSLSSQDGVLFNKNKTFLVRYPQNRLGDYEIPSSVSSLAIWSFSSNQRLTSVKIPASISHIPENAFWASRDQLKTVVFLGDAPTSEGGSSTFGAMGSDPDLVVHRRINANGYSPVWYGYPCSTYDSRYSFRIENNGASMVITDYLDTESGSLTIPSDIMYGVVTTGIGDEAFMDCTGLTEIILPSSVTAIGVSAFKNCTALTHFELPQSVTSIEDFTFENCASLAQIILPDNVTSIGAKAFYQCSLLNTLTIPAQVTNIGDYAFNRCFNLDSVFFEGDSPTIGTGAFVGSAEFTVYYRQENSGFTAPWHSYTPVFYSGPFEFSVSNEEVEVTHCSTVVSGILTMPSEIVGKPVVTIGRSTFVDCPDLTRVIMPDSIRKIEIYAFVYCPKLFTVRIPVSVTEIEEGAFNYCPLINQFSVDVGNSHYLSSDGILYNINQTTLVRCPEKKSGSYTLPSQVTRVSASAFSQCSKLTEVTLSDDLVSLGGYAFLGCSSLTRVTLPEQVNALEGAIFKDCTKLKWAVFLGDGDGLSRDLISEDDFANTDPDFRIYYLNTKSGFATPSWHGYPTTEINISTHPAALWLLDYDLAHDADLSGDESGDGVNLLMNYACGHDPHADQRGLLPIPVIGESAMEMTYHAESDGVSYYVEVSPDLSPDSWTSNGVATTDIDANGNRTAVWITSGAKMFMRLRVAAP